MNDETGPDTPCPEWCVMHVDRRHVGELELASVYGEYNIYVRPVDYGENQVGMQVVVATPDGKLTTRVEIGPGEVMESAMLADLRASIAQIEGNAPPGGEGDEPPQGPGG